MSSQIAVALMPVLGIGGFYVEADSFEGEGGVVYPEKTDFASPVATDTPSCEERPMIVIELDEANVDRFDIRKDIELPHLTNRWMSIRIEQPFGSTISGDQLSLYTTQLQANDFTIRNIIMREAGPNGNSNDKWGPESGEFYLEGGDGVTNPAQNPGIEASGVEAWIHGVTGQQITFESAYSSYSAINVELEYPTETELESWYEDDDRLGYGDPPDTNPDAFGYQRTHRDNYFDCVPP